MDRTDVADTLDELVVAATPWHRLVDLLAVAYSHGTHSRPQECRTLLVDCYMSLLPQPLQPDCSIIDEHRSVRWRWAGPLQSFLLSIDETSGWKISYVFFVKYCDDNFVI